MTTARLPALALLGASLAWLAAGEARAEDVPTHWRDPVVLRRHLNEACLAVESVAGGCFSQRPTVRVSTQQDILRILRARYEGEMGMLESTPTETRRFIAYYDPSRLEVHLLPDELAATAAYFQSPALLGEDVLRMVLVHEVTHALDFQRFPVRWTLACCAAADERLATEAVLEGHAQLVAEQVARRWGLESAFQRLTQLYTGTMEPPGAGVHEFDQESAFVYIQGHAFLRAVLGAQGEAGVDAVLRDPPFETRVIDRPLLYLQPALRGREHDLKALLEAFRPLVPAGDWEANKWRLLGPSVPVSVAEEAVVVESYLDNHGFFAATPGGGRYVNVFVAQFGSAPEADRFVGALRRADESRDAAREWQPAARRDGAGLAARLPGFTSRRRAVGGAQASELTLRVAREEQYVIELSSYGVAGVESAAQDQALDHVARLLRSPPTVAVAEAFHRHLRAFLTARAAGRLEDARVLMRDLLPSEADLRRVVRPTYADVFAYRYDGVHLELRTTVVPDPTVRSAFAEAGPDSGIEVWAATTEELAAGTGPAGRFPPPMRTFARDVAAPGLTWVLLVLEPSAGAPRLAYPCFVRLADRFLWIQDPWSVL